MKKTRQTIRFGDLPADFARLCAVLTPRPIHDRAEYDGVIEIVEAMALWKDSFSPDQDDYFEILCMLLENYDQENPKWSKGTPIKTLKFLLQEHALKASDLSRIIGASRTLGPMILRGERSITAEHARKLGRYFRVPAGIFIE